MTLGQAFTDKLVRWIFSLAILAMIAVLVCSYQPADSTGVMAAQNPRQQRRSRPRPKTQNQTQEKSSLPFNHENHQAPKTKLNCTECHAIPSREAPDAVVAATKPNIKGYPYHDSCLECHRRQKPTFFSGATPTICRVCHTRSTPHLTASEVYPQFPKQISLASRQLPGYFPHDKHRQVISDVKKDANMTQVSCAGCHRREERIPVAFLIRGDENSLTPMSGTFQTSPDLPNSPPGAHAYCFSCHWEPNAEKKSPGRNDCTRCHLTQSAFVKKESSVLLPIRAAWFTDWPKDWPRRVSLKFRHERKEHATRCTDCHASIVKTETLNKTNVSMVACLKCHKSDKPKIYDELKAEAEDSKEIKGTDLTSTEGRHKCVGCHTTLIGSAPPPCSHYKLDEETYLTGDFPKVSKRCEE